MADDIFEVVEAWVCAFFSGLEAVAVVFGADEVDVHVPDEGHVLWAVSGSQPDEIVGEDDIEDPVEAVFDAQWARSPRAKTLQLSRTEIIASLGGDGAVS